MTRYSGIIEYIGTKYCGMQKQNNITIKTIQGEIEKAFLKLTKYNIEINYSGRTDAMVHAKGQVISFSISENIKINQKNIISGLNYFLKNEDIALKSIKVEKENFSPRYDAKLRTYKYFINLEKTKPTFRKNTHFHFYKDLDLEKISIAKEYLIGKHDFSSFCKKTAGNLQNPIRKLENITFELLNDELIFTISAKSFLHNMVRIIIGTLLDVGTGLIYPHDIPKILDAKNRIMAGKTVPPHGLYFWEVKF